MSKTTVALPSKYCQFVKLDFGSHHRVEMLVAAQNYLQKRFVGLAELSDRVVQRQLWQQMRFCEQAETEQSYLAEVCLRCYISHQIYQVCFDLETKFGRRNGC
ncbi:MAG: hypothetical protein PUP91_19705 [Rhizonema sp. PD37]|nr:hypothetical protein [Rhizonema sp. PD37]